MQDDCISKARSSGGKFRRQPLVIYFINSWLWHSHHCDFFVAQHFKLYHQRKWYGLQESAYLHKTSQDSSAAKEKTQGDNDVGEESENQDNHVGLPSIAGLDHLNRLLKAFPFFGMRWQKLECRFEVINLQAKMRLVIISITWKNVFAPGACSFK